MNNHYSREVDSIPVPGPSSLDHSFDQTENPSDTETLLKSFIKENLHGRYGSSGGASSSDESAGAEIASPRECTMEDSSRYGSVTPEPQPLTRSNVTLHDGIWQTGEEQEEEQGWGESSGSVAGGTKPISLSPPLKGIRMGQPGAGRRPWEQSLSDAESDHSYSSQDTMILRSTEEAARGHLKYLEMYNSGANASLPIPSTAFTGHHQSRSSVGAVNSNASSERAVEHGGRRAERGVSPSRRVRFADDVVFQEQEEGAAASSSSGPPQRCLNVDYSRLLGRSSGGDGSGDHEDQDDGYESTDNASSTSSSSNGTPNPQIPPGGAAVPQDGVMDNQAECAPAENLKTDYGYVDRSKVPSFRRMNMELRKKAMTRSAQMSNKTSVEDKLRALCVDTDQDKDHQDDIKQQEETTQPSTIDFEPRDASSPVPTTQYELPPITDPSLSAEGRYSIGNLGTIGTESREPYDRFGGALEQAQSNLPPYQSNTTHYSTYSNHEDRGISQGDREGGGINSTNSLRRTHSMYTESTHTSDIGRPFDPFSMENRIPTSIPDQPSRPAPVLKDRQSSPVRTLNSIDSAHADRNSMRTMSERFYPDQVQMRNRTAGIQRPMSDMYSSQPQLQMDSNIHNLGFMSSRFKSEPQLQRADFYGQGTDLTAEDVLSGSPESSGASSSEGSYRLQDSYGHDRVYHLENVYARQSPYTTYKSEHPHMPDGCSRPESPIREQYPYSPQSHYNTEYSHSSHVLQRPQSAVLTVNRSASPARSSSPGQRSWTERQPNEPNHNPQREQKANNDIPGLFVYRSGSPGTHRATSDEHLNISGSTGSSNDSGIEQQSIEGSQGSGGYPSTQVSSESSGRRAPVNYTMDDISRDPMGMVEKLRYRRDVSPAGRAMNYTPPPSRNNEKEGSRSSLIPQIREFHTPSAKDLSRMRTQHRASPSGQRTQPMKALPLKNDEDWNEKLETTAKKMLDSHGNNMQNDYARYLRLYAKFQQEKRENPNSATEDTNLDESSRRSSCPEYGTYGQISYGNSRYTPSPQNPLPNGASEHSDPRYADPKPSGPRPAGSSVKYMRTADIYKMLEEQRGGPRLSRSQPSTPTQTTAPEWDTIKQSEGSQRMNNSLENIQLHYSDYGRQTPSPDQTYHYNIQEASRRHSPVNVGVPSRGGTTIRAKNADIYSLYTGTARHSSAISKQ